MNKLKLIVIISCILSQNLFVNLFAQEKDFLPYFIPPSPTAYELGKYGQIPVGLFTGTPNIGVPLYEYKTKNLSVPISLSYNSNGIRVDQVESNVGMGWSLNAGGVISKIVRDKPDESSRTLFPEGEITNIQDPMTIQYFYDIGQGTVDSETDLFMFNFQGHSGKFVYDKDKRIVIIPYQDMKIEPYDDGTKSGYQITTSDGVKYLFTTIERTTNSIAGEHPEERNVVTAWYLSKITHPSGDEIYFTYSGQGYYYTSSMSQTLEVPDFGSRTCDGSIYPSTPKWRTQTTTTRIQGVILAGISSNNTYDGQVTFTPGYDNESISNYDLISNISVKNKDNEEIEKFDFQYLTTTKKRMFLQKITFKDSIKYYEFEYEDPEHFPQRLSYSQDHWGYYNGKNNSVFTPKLTNNLIFENLAGADKEPYSAYTSKGILRKVTYPTKGYTQIDYEANTYYGDRIIPAHEAHYSLSSEWICGNTSAMADTFTLNIAFDQRIRLGLAVSSTDDGEHGGTGHERGTFSIENTQTGVKQIIYSADGSYNNISSFGPEINGLLLYSNLKTGTYLVTLKAGHLCTDAGANMYYYDRPASTVRDNIETGGLRVRSTIIHDPVNNQDVRTRYYYGPMENPEQSSGDPGASPYYLSNKVSAELCSTGSGGSGIIINYVNSKVLSSSSLNSLFNTGNSNVYYQYVTISNGGDNFENGGEQHEFIIYRDDPGNNRWGNDIKGAPYTNIGWDHALEKQAKVFKKEGSVFKVFRETTNNYVTDNRNYSEVLGYSVRKNYEMIASSNPVYTCTASDVTKRYKYYYCAANHEHVWHVNNFGETSCVAPNANNTYRWIEHPCYGEAIGYQFTRPNNIDNLDIVEYKNISFWSYLDNTTTTQFNLNGGDPVTTYTKYYYDNPEHIQLSRVEMTDSKGERLLKRTYYPDDDLASLGYSSEQVSLIGQLGKNALYRIAEPVQTEQWVNGIKTMTTRTIYKNWIPGSNLILPEEVQTASRNNSLEARLKFFRYDNKGNPLEFSKKNDVINTYYWGYNGKYPVAKFENMPYSVIDNTSNGLLTELDKLDDNLELSNQSDRGQLTATNNSIRSKIPVEAMVSTYTYVPLIGLASQTDVNNVTTYFNYDDFGRLVSIKDAQWKLLKSYNYHYSGQSTEGNFLNYTISTSSNTGGTITPANPNVEVGKSITINMVANTGFRVKDVKIDGISLGNISTYTFPDVKVKHSLIAEFEPIIYTISFNSQGGSIIPGKTTTYNTTIAAPILPTRAGYTFNGWYKEPACSNAWNFNTEVITADITLYAKWTAIIYTITFYSEGGSAVPGKTATYFTTITAPTSPTRAGYIFGGWYTEPDCTHAWNFSHSVVTTNLALFAKWTAIIYTVSFNSQGGSAIPGKTTTYNTTITAPTLPTRTGYTFNGWYKEPACSNAWNFNTDAVTANITLYAKWTAIIYTIIFNSQGGSVVTNKTATYNMTITAPAMPTKAGYIFDGWYREAACINAWNFNTNVITASIILYAKWTAIIYTVSFNSQGGSAIPGKTTTYNTVITAPTLPTRTGYTFLGWFKEPACTNAWNFSTDAVTSNITLYAKWTINSYSITVSKSGSGTISPDGTLTLNYGQSASYTFTPATNYIIKDVKIDGVSVGAVNHYTFNAISANHSIVVEFGIILSVNKSSLTFPGEGGTDTFIISSCLDWTITNSAWIYLSASSGNGTSTIQVQVHPNRVQDRYGSIVISAGGKSHTINVIAYKLEFEHP